MRLFQVGVVVSGMGRFMAEEEAQPLLTTVFGRGHLVRGYCTINDVGVHTCSCV